MDVDFILPESSGREHESWLRNPALFSMIRAKNVDERDPMDFGLYDDKSDQVLSC